MPTSLMHQQGYQRQQKQPTHILADGNANKAIQQMRKRKVDGGLDDRMLDIKAPILFVIGQNSARTSQEEMEGLRERMQSESSLVVVGSADDALRVPKSKRRIEGVTQSMVDYMVVVS